MLKNNNEFDKEIRSILMDGEEEVPSHIIDDVFSRLDNQASEKSPEEEDHKHILPLWFKYISSAGIAAALLSGIFLLYNSRNIKVNDNITASVEHSVQPEQYGQDATIGNITAYTEQHAARIPAENLSYKNFNSSPEKTSDESGTTDNAIANDLGTTGEDGNETSADYHQELMNKSGNDTPSDNNQQNVRSSERSDTEEDPFHIAEDTEETHKRIRISYIVNGDVSSNGNPNNISKFGGLRAPETGIRNATYIRQTSENSTFAVPLSFGLATRISIGKRWGIGAGVNYSLLQRSFSGTFTKIAEGKTIYNINTDIHHSLHYIGIPVNVYYDILSGSRVKLYTYAGGTVEKCVANVYRIENSPKDIIHKEAVKGVQLSAGAGLGLEFAIVDNLGVYINPGLRYYFDCNQPTSIRTQQPLMMNFEIGLKVNL